MKGMIGGVLGMFAAVYLIVPAADQATQETTSETSQIVMSAPKNARGEVTTYNVDDLRVGDSIYEAERLLGSGGKITARSGNLTMVYWRCANGRIMCGVSATFHGRNLMSFTRMGV